MELVSTDSVIISPFQYTILRDP